MSFFGRVLAVGLTGFLAYSHYTHAGVLQTKTRHYQKDAGSWRWSTASNTASLDPRYSFRLQMTKE